MKMSKRPFSPKLLTIAIRNTLLGASSIMALSAPTITFSGDIDDLRHQIELLMNKVEQLETQQKNNSKQTEELKSRAIVQGASPGSFTTSNGKTSFEVSGYLKLDAIIDLDADVGDTFVASSIPTDGSVVSTKNPHTRLHARQSRLRFKTNSELDDGKNLKTHLEGDFFGGGGNQSFSGSTSFRIRHAYASIDTAYGNFLAGQYWTNFMDFVAYPGTVDFFGPAGKSFKRQGQLRWTMHNGMSFSLENPETDGVGAAGRLGESRGGIGQDEMPDTVIAWRGGNGPSFYELAGVWRRLGINGVAPAGSDLVGTRIDVSKSGWGINLAGGWDIGKANINASTTFGDGIGSYIINGFSNDLFVNTNGSVETVESMSVNAAVKIKWNKNTNSTFAYGHFENDIPARSNGIDSLSTYHANFMWGPWPSTELGIELMHGQLDNADGSSGDATRLQFSVQRNI